MIKNYKPELKELENIETRLIDKILKEIYEEFEETLYDELENKSEYDRMLIFTALYNIEHFNKYELKLIKLLNKKIYEYCLIFRDIYKNVDCKDGIIDVFRYYILSVDNAIYYDNHVAFCNVIDIDEDIEEYYGSLENEEDETGEFIEE